VGLIFVNIYFLVFCSTEMFLYYGYLMLAMGWFKRVITGVLIGLHLIAPSKALAERIRERAPQEQVQVIQQTVQQVEHRELNKLRAQWQVNLDKAIERDAELREEYLGKINTTEVARLQAMRKNTIRNTEKARQINAAFNHLQKLATYFGHPTVSNFQDSLASLAKLGITTDRFGKYCNSNEFECKTIRYSLRSDNGVFRIMDDLPLEESQLLSNELFDSQQNLYMLTPYEITHIEQYNTENSTRKIGRRVVRQTAIDQSVEFSRETSAQPLLVNAKLARALGVKPGWVMVVIKHQDFERMETINGKRRNILRHERDLLLIHLPGT